MGLLRVITFVNTARILGLSIINGLTYCPIFDRGVVDALALQPVESTN